MTCNGCGNARAVVIRYWHDKVVGFREICDMPTCGDLRVPWVPDAYFKGPETIEHLADDKNPYGMKIESKRHKARVMRDQGVREDGDRYHGAIEKGARYSRPVPSKEFQRKLKTSITKSLSVLKRRP